MTPMLMGAAGGTSLSASLPSTMSAADGTTVPTGAYAAIQLSSSGTWSATNGGSGTWKNTGNAGDYEARMTGTGNTPSGDAVGSTSWLRLDVLRLWSLSTSGGTVDNKNFAGQLEIRPYGGGSTLASSTFDISAITEV